MFNTVAARLKALNIPFDATPNGSDDTLVNHSIDRVTNYIKSRTNLKTVPEGLFEIAVDKVVAEFLTLKQAVGLLDIERINFDEMPRRVKDGDTDTEYAVYATYSPQARFKEMLKQLQHDDADYQSFRVLTW